MAAGTGDSGYYVYVLRNRVGILYTGIAKDVAARLAHRLKADWQNDRQWHDRCPSRSTT